GVAEPVGLPPGDGRGREGAGRLQETHLAEPDRLQQHYARRGRRVAEGAAEVEDRPLTLPEPVSPMNRATLPLAVLSLLIPSATLRADDAEAKTVEALTKLGATVERDAKQDGKPVVGVNLTSFQTRGTVTDDTLKELVALKRLRTVSLFACDKVTAAGLKELAACKELRTLSLLNCPQVNGAFLKELAAYPQLRTLNLSGCEKVSDADLKELAACKQLETLDLSGCTVSA